MTPFEQGFINKCAEYNVNPEQLVKQAGLMGMLRRYGELLTGSGAKRLSGELSGLEKVVHGKLGKMEAAAEKDPAIKEFIDHWILGPARRYSDANVKSLRDVSAHTLSSLRDDVRNFIDSMEYNINENSKIEGIQPSSDELKFMSTMRDLLPGDELNQAAAITKDLAAEKLKSQIARLGTGVGAVGLGTGLGGYGLYRSLT